MSVSLVTQQTCPCSQPVLARGVGAVVVACALFLALWVVVESVAQVAGGAMGHLSPALPVLLLVALAGGIHEYRHGGFPVAEGAAVRQDAPGWGETAAVAVAAAALAVAPAAGAWLAAAWLVALAALLVLAWRWRRQGPGPDGPAGPERPRADGLALALCVLAAVAVTLLSNRPDPDDLTYLRLAMMLNGDWQAPIHALSFPAWAVNIHRWIPYSALVAALAHPPASVLAVYYLILPACQAVMVVAVAYLCARAVIGGAAGLTVLVAVLMLVAWGEAHRVPGNFAFVRLFHGKAAMASWALPLVFLSGVRLARRLSSWNAVILAVAAGAATCLSHSALVLAPVSAGLGVLAGWPRPWGRAGVFGLAGVLAAVMLGIAVAQVAAPALIRPRVVDAAISLSKVFPWGFRSAWALAAVAVAGVVLAGSGGVLVRRLALMIPLVVINPWLMAALARLTESLSWRIAWTVPFPVLAAAAVVAIGRRERCAGRPPVLAVVVLVSFLGAGAWTVSGATGNRFGTMGLLMDPGFSRPLYLILNQLRRPVPPRQGG